MPTSATTAGTSSAAAAGPPVPATLCATTSTTPARPSARPAHCVGAHAFAQEQAGAERGEHRLQADHQRRDARRQPQPDRREHAAEIDRVDQQARTRRCAATAPRVAGQGARVASATAPISTQHRAVAQAQQRERLAIGQAQLGADEAGAPEDDEQQREARSGGEECEVAAAMRSRTRGGRRCRGEGWIGGNGASRRAGAHVLDRARTSFEARTPLRDARRLPAPRRAACLRRRVSPRRRPAPAGSRARRPRASSRRRR